MSLLDLPAELLDHITSFTLPEGIESLALSCKTIYNIAKDHIVTHNHYRNTWGTFSYDGWIVVQRNPITLLLAIAQDPLIARYITTANFWLSDPSAEASVNVHEGVFAEQEQVECIRRLLTDSPYLRKAGIKPGEWLNYLEGEDASDAYDRTNHATITLLTLLTNVSELQLPDYWTRISSPDDYRPETPERDRQQWDLLDTLIKEANDHISLHPALGKLQRITPYAPISYDQRNGLCELLPFMALNSVKEMYATNCVAVIDGYSGIAFKWRYPDTMSALRKVELAGACIDADGITELVRHTPQLTSLKYAHYTKWHGCQHDWSAGEFVAAIAEHRGDTLTDLAVTIDSLFGDIVTGVASLVDFAGLETAELDLDIFAGPTPASGERAGMAGSGGKWKSDDMPRLRHIMPSTVTRVDIFVCNNHAYKEAETDLELDMLTQLLEGLTPDGLIEVGVRSGKGILQWEQISDLLRSDTDSNGLKALCRENLFVGEMTGRQPLWREAFTDRFGDLQE